MPLITDPDQLNQGIEVVFSTAALTIALAVAGNLDATGVTGQALYSFCKEEWRTDNDLIKFPFPMQAITPEQFEFGNNGSQFSNWRLANDASRKLVRTAGWREYDSTGVTLREYAGIISLGTLGVTDQPYYQADAGAPVDFTYAGQVNEAVQVFGNAANGNLDYRSSFKLFAREQGKTYAQSQLSDIGVSTMTYQVYRFPLANQDDLKITVADLGIDANSDDVADIAPYSGMSITYYAAPQLRSIGGVDYSFSIIIDGNSASAEEIYEFVQWSLRRPTDIDAGAGSVTGLTADELLQFVGDTLRTKRTSAGQGVFIDDFNANDTNRLVFVDNTGTDRTFPFVAAGTLQFNPNLVNDASAKYWMFFTSAFGSVSAIIVNDNEGLPVTGNVSGQASIPFTFDYDGNNQGGRTPGTDAQVTVVALGLSTAQYVRTTATITRAVGQNISLVAALERNYQNPS